ncbi:Kelch repeat-containing protein [Paenibacillus sp. FSL R7-0331]|uniref:Kelch repeat-containing protein n=1 Tax=Paenibacillus sp. FSL R7-0331 TaxID=1536773 RepID=UPI000693A7B4|nr:kelch repeat-containing protein [Paenibacillus sp. FSL R7-0331]
MLKNKKIFMFIILLVISGVTSIKFVFASETDVWTKVTDLPDARAANAVVEVNGIIYSIGGSAGAMPYKDVQAYNPATNTWTKKADMPTARSSASVVVAEGKIYVLGGYTGNFYSWTGGSAVNTVEMYDPLTDSWTTKSPMLFPAGSTSAVNYNNKIYVFGGLTTNVTSIAKVQVYDTQNDSWSEKRSIPQAIHGTGAVTYNDKIYLVGGRYIGNNVAVDFFQEYDPLNDSWMMKTSLPTQRNAPSVVVYKNNIIAIGGSTPNVETASVVVYDFTTNSWSAFPSLNDARAGSSAVVYKDRIFVFGGSKQTTSNSPVGSVEVYGTETPEPTTTPTPTPSPSPEQSIGNRAILVVTMITGLEKEFDLSLEEVNNFITWYENKQSGSGTASYAINKHDNNKGPFTNRKDYIIFDKILTFEVNEYTLK